jgi:hypothetical protein
MSEITLRQPTAAGSPADPHFVAHEPSHIHIPRPSRLRQAASPKPQELQTTVLQPILAEEAAA